ncbi:HD-GYP domain-containing protein [Shewanella sp. 10N.261.52.F9]|uniref:HD-GYP domain-containing protein n=1 Tax=Shewanella sp. 10N.261.52.F9 TaxID=3229684 RepID=UPI00354F0A75
MTKSCKVAVAQLQIGNFVRLPIAWKDHPFIFNSFKIKQQAQIELIKNLGLDFVFVCPERSDTLPLTSSESQCQSDIIDNNLEQLSSELSRQKAKSIDAQQSLRRHLQKTEKHFIRNVAMMRNLMNKLRSRPLAAVNEAQELIHDMCNQLLTDDKLVLHLMAEAKSDDSIYYHSLNVAVLSMLIAKELEWSRKEIEIVGIGALFHDIGKLKVPTQLLRKTAPLTQAEQNYFNQHPAMGAELIGAAENFPEQALPIILNHHEFLDGSGVPNGLKEPQIDKLSQLICAINTYDNLCHSDRSKKAKTPYAALGFLYKNYQNQLNQQVINRLVKMLGIYPPGSIVELSSGQFAMVMSVNLSKLLLPRVLVYDPTVPKEQAPIVDLANEGLTIVRCLPIAALPLKVLKYLDPRDKVSYFFGAEK